MIGISIGGDSDVGEGEGQSTLPDAVEIAAQGFFGRPSAFLRWLGARCSVLLRAPHLSLGTPGPVDPEELDALAALSECAQCHTFVQPLGFSNAGGVRLDATIPIRFSESTVALTAEHVIRARESLGRPILVEPITATLRIPGSLAPAEFLYRLCHEAECRFLLDISTLLIESRNRAFDPHRWLAELPPELIGAARVGGVHLEAGRWRHHRGRSVDAEAWLLLEQLLARGTPDHVLLAEADDPGHGEHGRRDFERLARLVDDARSGASIPSEPPGRLTAADLETAPTLIPMSSPSAPRLDRPLVSPDVSLFVLEDEGVCFSAERRELSLFNTQATLVWCLLEDGLDADAITQVYQRAFGVATDQAAGHVGSILRQWFGQGYISHPGTDAGTPVPLTAALAQLLTNERLRAEFRHSPSAVGAALKLMGEDFDAFRRLDPDEVDLQAEEIRIRSKRSSPRRPTARTPPTQRTRCYRLVATTFALEVGSESLRQSIHESLSHLEQPEGQTDVTLKLRRARDGGFAVFSGSSLLARCGGIEGVVPTVKMLMRSIAVENNPGLLSVHAGVVSFGEGCVVMPATAGSGKTTLTAALIQSGATYLSDEIGILEEGSLAARPVPLALTVKAGSLAPLREYYPDIDSLAVHRREDHVEVRYLPPPAKSLPDTDAPHRVGFIVFPAYDRGEVTELRPMARPTALRKLLAESRLSADKLDRQQAEALVQWMRTTHCFELPFHSLPAAVALLRTLMRSDAVTP